MSEEIDVIKKSIVDTKVTFTLNPKFWEDFDQNMKKSLYSSFQWNEIKFLDENKELHKNINNVPTDFGGIYLFVAKPNILSDAHYYLLYVGRARKTNNQNLRKRCKEYFNEIKKEKRPLIHRMLNTWGDYLYIRYIPLADNDEINRIEAELINRLLPPFNYEIPDKKIRDAVKAFSI